MIMTFALVIICALLLIFLLIGIKALKNPYSAGREGIVGMVGEARTNLNPKGSVFVNGTRWNAVSLEGDIPKGSEVIVVSVEGLKLAVRKVN